MPAERDGGMRAHGPGVSAQECENKENENKEKCLPNLR